MTATATSADVHVRDVYKSFGPVEIIRGVSFRAPAGQTTCIIGPSGSGKSTLLRCVNRLERVDRGSIMVGGTEVTARDADLDRVRSRIGMVSQKFNLFPHISVLDNVTLAPRVVLRRPVDDARDEAMRQLERVGLGAFAHRRPASLSGGQQQRVAIARALAMRPEVMLFDEPTSALDPELVHEVLEVMADLAARGMTLLVVTHELRFARKVASHVIFIDEGRIGDEGPPDRLFTAPANPRLASFLSRVGGGLD
ncbi:MAG TPA: amino acid ABC transporter ATP-binding protein [Acidimicrobiales bacterium]|nr:amino acid ABC transporter ATP-binding protein [Acidimicrobiales bacterium]